MITKFINIAIALDILKAFEKMQHRRLLHKHTSYGIPGRIFSMMKLGSSMKVVVNGHPADTNEINTGFPPPKLEINRIWQLVIPLNLLAWFDGVRTGE